LAVALVELLEEYNAMRERENNWETIIQTQAKEIESLKRGRP
jgi:hypothetical protein